MGRNEGRKESWKKKGRKKKLRKERKYEERYVLMLYVIASENMGRVVETDPDTSLAFCSPWGCKEPDTSERLNSTEYLNTYEWRNDFVYFNFVFWTMQSITYTVLLLAYFCPGVSSAIFSGRRARLVLRPPGISEATIQGKLSKADQDFLTRWTPRTFKGCLLYTDFLKPLCPRVIK